MNELLYHKFEGTEQLVFPSHPPTLTSSQEHKQLVSHLEKEKGGLVLEVRGKESVIISI